MGEREGGINWEIGIDLYTLLHTKWGFPGGSVVKNLPANAGDAGSIPGLGRFPWRRKWQAIPVFLPWTSRRQRSLVGYSLWGHKSQT